MSVNTSAHNMRGFHQWDEEWDLGYYTYGVETYSKDNVRTKNLIPCIPNTTYYINSHNRTAFITFYDINGQYIPDIYTGNYPQYGTSVINSTIITPINCHFMTFNLAGAYGKVYKNDICINISDLDKNGTYEPYHLYSYPLDDTLTLNGLYKLDADNKLYCDGDTYESDGTVTRNRTRYTVPSNVGLTKDPISSQTTIRYYFNSVLDNCNSGDTYGICDKLSKVDYFTDAVGFYINNKRIYIKLNVNTVEEARAIVAGATFEYNVETSTTETADSYTNPQVSTPGGTEQYIDYAYSQGTRDVEIPVGHETLYK